MLYKARKEASKFYDNYFLMASEAKIKAQKEAKMKQQKIRDLKY